MDRKSTDNLTTIMICLGSLGIGIANNLNDYASVWSVNFVKYNFYFCLYIYRFILNKKNE